ncbi:MAG: hypothetical protein M1561_04315 [Gammaproteobacteria bacterium]|nr:hypothetical protein [Gammaproteobacteria bacterium]
MSAKASAPSSLSTPSAQSTASEEKGKKERKDSKEVEAERAKLHDEFEKQDRELTERLYGSARRPSQLPDGFEEMINRLTQQQKRELLVYVNELARVKRAQEHQEQHSAISFAAVATPPLHPVQHHEHHHHHHHHHSHHPQSGGQSYRVFSSQPSAALFSAARTNPNASSNGSHGSISSGSSAAMQSSKAAAASASEDDESNLSAMPFPKLGDHKR